MKHTFSRRLPTLAAALFLLLAASAACGQPGPGADGVYRQEDFDGKKIGFLTGTIYAEVVATLLPKAEPAFFSSKHDVYFALELGKIPAAIDAEVSAKKFQAKHPEITILYPRVTNTHLGVVMRKGNTALREEINDFIRAIKADGTYDDMMRRWIEEPVTPPMPDIPLTGENGTLVFGSAGSSDGFSYFDNGVIVGFDIEFAKRFAQRTGRKLDIATMEFGALIPAVHAGKLDFAANNFVITEERKKNVDFSIPYFETGGVISVLGGPKPEEKIFRPGDFAGKKVGGLTGAIFDRILAEHIPGSQAVYFQSPIDYVEALKAGKLDAVCDDDAIIRRYIAKDPGLVMLTPTISRDHYGAIMDKDKTDLKRELDGFIAKVKADGTHADMLKRWLDTATPPPMPDIAPGSGPRTITFATAAVADGFSYMKDGRLAGFDIEFAKRFAAHVDAALEIVVTDFSAMFIAVQTGKADFAANLITITEERQKNVLFSEPYYEGGSALCVLRDRTGNAASASDEPAASFWEKLRNSFQQNLTDEGRWKMILQGLAVTLLISFASFVLGTVLGFIVCYLNMSSNALLRLLGRAYVILLRGTPIVVLLMIIYYVVFASVNISSVLVAVIAYGLNAGAYIGEIIRSAILTVDKGQIEAARSMGFSTSSTFLNVTLPQAARVALPVYKSEFVSLVKSTAVVGYIAVVDLTKAGDIIRSRTYDAFFPLLTVAAIYLVTTGLVVWLFDWIGKRTDKRSRRAGQ